MEIVAQNEKIKYQANMILSLQQKLQSQSDEILHFRAKFQCGLVKFAVEAKDPKVNNYFQKQIKL